MCAWLARKLTPRAAACRLHCATLPAAKTPRLATTIDLRAAIVGLGAYFAPPRDFGAAVVSSQTRASPPTINTILTQALELGGTRRERSAGSGKRWQKDK